MLRKELQPPSINEELLPIVEEIIESIAVQLENGCYDIDENNEFVFDNDEEAQQINMKALKLKEFTKKDIEIMNFYHYWNHISLDDLARELLMPEPPYLDNITVAELTEIIEEFFNTEHIEEYYQEYYMKLIEKSFGVTGISDYIFYPDLKGTVDDSAKIAEKIIEDSKNPPIIFL